MHQTLGRRISKALFIHEDTPFICASRCTGSATMPPATLEHVRSILGMDAEKLFQLNLGNDRYNIVPLMWPVEGGTKNLAVLDFIVCGRTGRCGQSSISTTNVLQCVHVTTFRNCSPCCRATIEMGIVTCSLGRDLKHSVEIITSHMESSCFNSTCQVVHLALRHLDSGKCPFLGQRDTESAHSIESFCRSAAGFQVE